MPGRGNPLVNKKRNIPVGGYIPLHPTSHGPAGSGQHPRIMAMDKMRTGSNVSSAQQAQASPFQFTFGGGEGGSSIGGSIISGLFGQRGARKQNIASALEAQKSRDFQKMMSDTAHQRAMADLKKAGLNPILAARSPASSPGGAMASQFNEAQSAMAAASQQAGINQQLQTIKSTKIRNELMAAQIPLANATANFWSKPSSQKKLTFDQYVASALGLSQVLGNLFPNRSIVSRL